MTSGLPSDPASSLAELTAEQQVRLADLLDQFLSALESGAPLDADELARRHPDLAEPLRRYLDRLDELHQASATFFAGRGEPSDDDRSAAAPSGAPSAAEYRGPEFASAESTGSPTADAASPARRLGDFELGDEIGRGGMGVVYEARQISLDRRVALKVLPFAAVLDARQIARFKNEAKAAAQLHHPHIVPVYAVGVERGVHYYAMQRIDGRPLDQLVELLRAARREPGRPAARRSPDAAQPARAPNAAAFDESTARLAADSTLDRWTGGRMTRVERYRAAARLGVQAAEALDAAHQEGIVHRDVKPSNLLVDRQGKLWVTDFGLARMHGDARLSRTGDVIGTWRYMSPEQARGESALVDPRTDVYSLGVTLWELLALEPAYADDDRERLLLPVDELRPPRLTPRCPELPADLETVVLKAMAGRREERYATAAALADDLRRVLDGRPTVARPPTWLDRCTRIVRRHRRWMAAGAAALLVLTVVSTVATVLTLGARRQAERDFARAERNYRDARHVVDRFGAGLAEQLSELPGAEALRAKLLRDTLGYYQQFVRDADDDPQLEVDIALTLSKIGELAAECGALDEALDADRQAVQRLGRLVADQPRSWELRRAAATARRRLADALVRTGAAAAARREYETAVRFDRQLLSERPADDESRSELIRALEGFGRSLAADGDFDAARDALVEAVRSGREWAEAAPADRLRRRRLAGVLNRLGELYLDRQPVEALGLHRQALRQLEAVEPDGAWPAGFRLETAATHDRVAAAHARLSQWSEAADAYRRAIEKREPLLALEPQEAETTVEARAAQATSWSNLGRTLSKQGRREEVAAALQQAVELQESVVARRPEDVEERRRLAGIDHNLGVVWLEMELFTESEQAFQRAIAERLRASGDPPEPDQSELLDRHYLQYGRLLVRLKRWDDALQLGRSRQSLGADLPIRLQSVADELRRLDEARRAAGEPESAELQTLIQQVEKQAGRPTPDPTDDPTNSSKDSSKDSSTNDPTSSSSNGSTDKLDEPSP